MTSSSRRSSSPVRRALAALVLAALPATAQQTLKVATLVPEGSLWDKELRELGAAVQSATEGRVRFLIYPGGVAGDEPDLLRKLRMERLQGALFSAPGLGDVDPAFYLFQVPLLFEDDAEVQHVLAGIRPELEKRLDAKGMVLLHWSNVGWLRFFASKPLASFEDFKARKQFVWGSETRLVQWYQELGLRPVSLAATDVLTGLQTGLIESLPVTPLAALSLQWFRSAPYMLDHRFAPLLGGLVLSKSAWAKVSEADRATILRLAAESERDTFAAIPEREAEALREMARRGLKIAEEPASDAARWLELGKAFQQRFREFVVPPEILDRVIQLLEEHRRTR